MFQTVRKLLARTPRNRKLRRGGRRRNNPVPACLESLESRATLTLPSLSVLMAAFATQVDAAIQPKVADANTDETLLFTNEVEPEFTALGTDFSALAPTASSVIASAVVSFQGDFGMTMFNLSSNVDQVDNWVTAIKPSFTYTAFPILVGTPYMMGDAMYVAGDGFSYYADSFGIRWGSVDKTLTSTVIGGGTLETKWKGSVGDLSASKSVEYSNSLVTPTVTHKWGVSFLPGQTAPQDQLKLNRSFIQTGGPLTLSTDATFTPLGLQAGGVGFKWKSDPVRADFNWQRRLTGTDIIHAKVNLSVLDSGLWKPSAAVGRMINDTGTTRIAGLRFENPDGKVFVGRGFYTPLTGPTRTYDTYLAVFKRPDAQWEASASYVNSEGTNTVGGLISVTQPINAPIFGIFNPKFGVGVTYSTGPFPGMIVPSGFTPIPPGPEGFRSEVYMDWGW